jgi:hypothetical protein
MGLALAIWAEETVMQVARVLGWPEGTAVSRIVGFLWIVAWMSGPVDALGQRDCHVWVLGWLSFGEPYPRTDLSACTSKVHYHESCPQYLLPRPG